VNGFNEEFMKNFVLPYIALVIMLFGYNCMDAYSQDGPVNPGITGTGHYLGLTPPLKDLPVLTREEFLAMEAEGAERNAELQYRSYPFSASALPKGPDPVWQRDMGNTAAGRGLILNFNGQTSPYFPPDANGTAGPLYYMQTINTVYAIYDKTTGDLVAGPTDMNQLFSGVPGANCNDGDPLVLYDEQADRWLAVEFSICASNDRMLIAVSLTNDPTGSWHKYSFDVADLPDYEKFGIWEDGYYMGTNNSFGNDIYVFERQQMLDGGTAQFVGFNNPWRPTTIDGFMCVPPLDNDGPAAPEGTPGMFITITDDAIAGGSDQLWIYELQADWGNPNASTFNRVQQLGVPAFDSNFGNDWDNIKQPGTWQELDGIPQVIMNRPQYRNFGDYETILCCHTVDVDATDHAGIRWYELRRSGGGDWDIRQAGTYSPDEHSRWMGAVSLNGQNEIGLAYSISSTTVYPGIRFCGQSAEEYATASGILDIAEEIIQTSSNSQTGANRWGDYADLSVDPDNDRTFWFTSQYPGSGGSRRTKIASFEFAAQALTALFSASVTSPCQNSPVAFTDQSLGGPVTWEWTLEGGTPSASAEQNPVVIYETAGVFDVRLVVFNGNGSDTLLMEDYIQVVNLPGEAGIPEGPADVCKGAVGVPYIIAAVPFAVNYEWLVNPPEAGTISGTDTIGLLDVAPGYTGQIGISVRPVNDCGSGTISGELAITSHAGPAPFNLPPDGGFCEGGPGFEIVLDGSEIGVSYELHRDGVPAGTVLPGTGNPVSFGFQVIPGSYTVVATDPDCSLPMPGSTIVYYIPGPEVASAPTGPAELCNSETGVFSTTGAPNATLYVWHLDPASAGTISGDGTTASATWNPAFSGTVKVTVQGADECGTGPMSDALQVVLRDAPHPALTGQDEPCSVASNSLYFYSTATNPDNSYSWQVVGGNLVTGQGSHLAMVTWAEAGEGMIVVTESAPTGCSTADTLLVSIKDCTGIPENGAGAVSLYPNPVEDKLTIKADTRAPGTATILVFSSFGQPVMQREVVTDQGRVDLTVSTTELAAGTYYLQIVSAKGKVFEGKFVKSGL
jgi:PKD repeat protein